MQTMVIDRTITGLVGGIAFSLASISAYAQSSPSDNKYGVPAVTTSEPQPLSDDGVTPIGTGDENRGPTRAFTNQFGLSVGMTVTDNIVRGFNETAQSGALLTISPSYTGLLQTRRSWADISLGLDYEAVYPTGSGTQPRADAFGGRFGLGSDLSLAGDAFRLATSASIIRASDLLSNAGLNSLSDQFLDEDSTTIEVSPYSRGEIGASNRYELRVQSRFLDPAGTVPHSLLHRVLGDIGTNPAASSTFGWDARVAAGTTRIDDGTRFDQLLSELTLSALLADSFRLGAGVNYVTVDGIRDDQGNDSGVGPSVFFEWRPARATRLRARLARAYFGNLIDASLTRASSNWAMRLSYREGFEERNALASVSVLDLRNAFAIDRADLFANNTVVRGLGSRGVNLSYGTELEGNLVAQIQSPIIFDKTLTFSSGVLWPRSEALATLYASQINGAVAQSGIGFERVNRFGVNLTFGYALGRRNKIRFRLGHRLTDLANVTTRSEKATESDFTLAWELRVSRRLLTTLGYRHSRESVNSLNSQLRVNSLYGLVNFRF